MRKLSLIILLILFMVGCTVINERYIDKRIVVRPTYGYVPYYGFSLWNPFWQYGLFSYPGEYYGRYYRSYRYYGYIGYKPTVFGRSVITKRQLRSPPVKRVPMKVRVIDKKSSGKVRKEDK